MRDAALSIRFSFSGASMDYSEDHSQLADVGILILFFLYIYIFFAGAMLRLELLYSFFLLGSTWKLTFICAYLNRPTLVMPPTDSDDLRKNHELYVPY